MVVLAEAGVAQDAASVGGLHRDDARAAADGGRCALGREGREAERQGDPLGGPQPAERHPLQREGERRVRAPHGR
eukprot:405510-Prorocentrum_minimum.AAC.1